MDGNVNRDTALHRVAVAADAFWGQRWSGDAYYGAVRELGDALEALRATGWPADQGPFDVWLWSRELQEQDDGEE